MRKLRKIFIMLLISLCTFGLTACHSEVDNMNSDNTTTADILGYEQINAEKAKEIMDSGVEHIIIDARTDEEFSEGHIEGAILIPEYEIAVRAEQELPDKDALILVYCRSGRRSKIASEELVNLGYTNVKEFGGIIDWHYEIVK
ncbi:MAG: rhodanese-like domain-containing protein [Ruminococcus sp.]|nr:rhodanese-like domain-containing protein [Oscillospiraceae bacterium]MBR2724547.1 rhodanese-like domain-containing protein [Ruminococcus sp.]